MSDINISFFVAGRFAGQIESSLEAFDAAPHNIPKRILNKIRNTQSDSVELSFSVTQVEAADEATTAAECLDKLKMIEWMYENGYFSLTSADMLTKEINKGTFNL